MRKQHYDVFFSVRFFQILITSHWKIKFIRRRDLNSLSFNFYIESGVVGVGVCVLYKFI